MIAIRNLAVMSGILCIAVFSTSSLAEDVQVFRIGVMGPLTGPQAAIGKDDENGVQLAIEELNSKKIRVGGKPVRFEMNSVDDAADPRIGVSVAQQLVDQQVNVVLGPFNSGVAIPTSKIFDNAGIPVAVVATNPQITAQGLKNVFRLAASDGQVAPYLARFASTVLRLKNIAVIDDRTAYGQGIADSFVKAAEANGIKIVDREYTSDKAIDFNAILTRIKSAHPDAIFFGGYYSQAGPLAKQMTRLAMNIPLLGGDGVCNSALSDLGGSSVDNRVYCPEGGPVLGTSSEGREFKANYVKRFKIQPLTFSASFYDGVMLVADAVRRSDSTDSAKVRDALVSSDMRGVAGRYEFDANHDLKNSPITVYTYKSGAMVPLPSVE